MQEASAHSHPTGVPDRPGADGGDGLHRRRVVAAAGPRVGLGTTFQLVPFQCSIRPWSWPNGPPYFVQWVGPANEWPSTSALPPVSETTAQFRASPDRPRPALSPRRPGRPSTAG